ncbi:17S U2 SnRNP complex component HTATSF1 [Onthophagus taurus]|uniref:17S U2 SnRNP complex component HTATSF1 n=1 Tax=Onthophagus taurus TaxID=166361 RepID=UPI0039BEB85A
MELEEKNSNKASINNSININASENNKETIKTDKKANDNNEIVQDARDNPNENQPQSQSTYDPKYVHYEGDIAIYTDPSSGYQYQWNKEREKWEAKAQNVEYGFEDDTHTYTDNDGTKFFWDKEKNAWFPKINDDFMAKYQMSYGFVDNTSTEKSKEIEIKESKEEIKLEVENHKGVKRKASEPSWFTLDDEQNTKVYVSNLPLDTTEEEFVDLMQKYGLIMRDTITHKMKIKMYKESGTDLFKGDALCTYIRVESVDLALKLLDGSMFKDKKIKVERAQFQLKGEYDPKLKPKTKKRKEKQKLKRMQEKLFDWRPEKPIGERAKHEKVVIIKNLFEPKLFDEDVGLILEFQQDLREEASKCGEVRKVMLYDRHPGGVAQINMKEPEEADAVVLLLNNRWFGKRKLTAEIWDGKTKYKIAETEAEISERIDNWDKYLEGKEGEKVQLKNVTD